MFAGMPGAGYGLGAAHLPSAYAMLGRGGSSAPGGLAPPPSPYSHVGGLGMNSAAWWTMATHLATQDYLARLQGATGIPGFPPGTESLLSPYSGLQLGQQQQQQQQHKSSKQKSSNKSSSSHHNKMRDHMDHRHREQQQQQQQLLTPTTSHSAALVQKEYSNGGGRSSGSAENLERQTYGSSQAQVPATSSSSSSSAATTGVTAPSGTHSAASSPNILR